MFRDVSFKVPEKVDHILRIACLGDVVGRPGREVVSEHLHLLKEQYQIDFAIVNGENAAGGSGIDLKTAQELQRAGADVVTLGDHTFHRKGSAELLQQHSSWCIRPINFPITAPGKGVTVREFDHSFSKNRVKIAVINLLGRTFIGGSQSCPFSKMDEALEQLKAAGVRIIACDFHAEATSEKLAMARYLDGRVSILFGTHTHVQTADAQLFPQGTAFITDLGMCGSTAGVIGMKSEAAIKRFISALPSPYEVAEGQAAMSGVLIDIDLNTNRAEWIGLLPRVSSSGMASQDICQP